MLKEKKLNSYFRVLIFCLSLVFGILKTAAIENKGNFNFDSIPFNALVVIIAGLIGKEVTGESLSEKSQLVKVDWVNVDPREKLSIVLQCFGFKYLEHQNTLEVKQDQHANLNSEECKSLKNLKIIHDQSSQLVQHLSTENPELIKPTGERLKTYSIRHLEIRESFEEIDHTPKFDEYERADARVTKNIGVFSACEYVKKSKTSKDYDICMLIDKKGKVLESYVSPIDEYGLCLNNEIKNFKRAPQDILEQLPMCVGFISELKK